jgi:hypothetical protein
MIKSLHQSIQVAFIISTRDQPLDNSTRYIFTQHGKPNVVKARCWSNLIDSDKSGSAGLELCEPVLVMPPDTQPASRKRTIHQLDTPFSAISWYSRSLHWYLLVYFRTLTDRPGQKYPQRIKKPFWSCCAGNSDRLSAMAKIEELANTFFSPT